MRIIVALIVFIVWCFGSWNWYLCKIKGLCSDNYKQTETVVENIQKPEPISQSGNLVFKWSDQVLITDDATPATIDSLKKSMSDEQLTITGLYRPDETNYTSFENLGLARAQAVKDFLLSKGGFENIAIEAREVGDSENTDLFKGVDFSFSQVESDGGFEFTETEGKIIINFPVASANPGLNKALAAELKKIAKHAIDKNEYLVVVGHTDNTGTHEANLKYGQLRAEVISKMLIADGVPSAQITAKSEGEYQPIATNDTVEGKKLNRRVEITIQ